MTAYADRLKQFVASYKRVPQQPEPTGPASPTAGAAALRLDTRGLDSCVQELHQSLVGASATKNIKLLAASQQLAFITNGGRLTSCT